MYGPPLRKLFCMIRLLQVESVYSYLVGYFSLDPGEVTMSLVSDLKLSFGGSVLFCPPFGQRLEALESAQSHGPLIASHPLRGRIPGPDLG